MIRQIGLLKMPYKYGWIICFHSWEFTKSVGSYFRRSKSNCIPRKDLFISAILFILECLQKCNTQPFVIMKQLATNFY